MRYIIIALLLLSSCADKISIDYNITPELYWFQQYGISEVETYPENSSTIFYNSTSRTYYFAIVEKTNSITYDTKKTVNETAILDYILCWGAKPNEQNTDLVYYPIQDPLIYIGSVDLTNRVYIDSNKNQYIKKLTKIDTSYYINYQNTKEKLQGSLFPYIEQDNSTQRIVLSNEFNQFFVFGNLRPSISNQYPNGTLFLKYYD